ncbi:hypothetical protein Chor_001707 [Crotalus horridus]
MSLNSPQLIFEVANATATEVRAKHNYFESVGYYNDHTGLSCFSPVLNIMRHPLWGRNQETYGEDPFLTTQLGIAFVKGLQGDHPRYVKTNAGCKHFDVHGGPENIPVSRFLFDAKVSENGSEVELLSSLDSSGRINGVPACANKKLLTDILRNEWGFQGYVVSDEGAVELIMVGHRYTQSFLETAIVAVNAGCNLELSYGMKNNVYMHIAEALSKGNISLEMIRDRVRPLFLTRLRLGEFDPPAMNPYNALGAEVIQSKAHHSLALKAALQSFVLLKNRNEMLPFKTEDLLHKTIAVVGPFADKANLLFGDYAPVPDPQYIYTPRRGLAAISANVTSALGCENPRCLQYNPKDVKAAIEGADVPWKVKAAKGSFSHALCSFLSGADLESESNDRKNLSLPTHQMDLLQSSVAWAAGRPVVLLLFNAGPLDISWAKDEDAVGAIVACFFPAETTGLAVAKMLVGAEGANPAGRLPATWPAGMHQYRDLVVGADQVPICGNLSISVVVENVGSRDGEEVVQLYLRWGQASVPMPHWQLVGFRRLPIRPGQAAKVAFLLPFSQRAVWAGQWWLEPGNFTIFVGGQQPFQEVRLPSNVLQTDFHVFGNSRSASQC